MNLKRAFSIAILVTVLGMATVGCSSVPFKERSYPVLAVTADDGCGDKGSVVLYELKDKNGNALRGKLPKRVTPGVYSIGIACAWVYNRDRNQCEDVRNEPASTAAYPLVLRADTDYTFSCARRILAAGESSEQIMTIGETRIPIDTTYDLKLKQSKCLQGTLPTTSR